MKFPKTVKGYIGKVKRLDDCVDTLKGFENLNEDEKDAITTLRAYIAEFIDTFKPK